MRFIIVFLTIYLMINGCSDNVPPVTDLETMVSGAITTNTIWNLSNSPYIVEKNVIVKKGATLTIMPGVEVKFNNNCGLIINGVLIADGINDDLDTKPGVILFTSNEFQSEMGDWNGIKFDNTNDNKSVVKHCKIEYADIAISCFSSAPTIENNLIRYNNTGVYLNSAYHVTVRNNEIKGNEKGLWCINKQVPLIEKNLIYQNVYGVYAHVHYSKFHLYWNNLGDNVDYDFYTDLENRTDIGHYTIDARNNWWGTTNTSDIEKRIYDYDDNSKLAKINYTPFSKSQILDAGINVE